MMSQIHKSCTYCSIKLGTSYYYTCPRCRISYCYAHKDRHECLEVEPPKLQTTPKKIYDFLRLNPNKWYTLEELGVTCKLKPSSISTVMSAVMSDPRVVIGKRPWKPEPRSNTHWIAEKSGFSKNEYTFMPNLKNRVRPQLMQRIGFF